MVHTMPIPDIEQTLPKETDKVMYYNPKTYNPKTYNPIYQQRFYVDDQVGWTDWETISKHELIDIREYISMNKQYQIRTLIECAREGYKVGE